MFVEKFFSIYILSVIVNWIIEPKSKLLCKIYDNRKKYAHTAQAMTENRRKKKNFYY